jgi:hypothetical protein
MVEIMGEENNNANKSCLIQFFFRTEYKNCFMTVYFLKYKQAERGFAKEASVYFPYLDSTLFHTVHYATLPFRHSAIPPFCHSAIPPFRHSAIPPFRHSAIPPFRHSAIPPFCSNTQ